jgi:succinate dehydrogenase hydrophobic anchor subunit
MEDELATTEVVSGIKAAIKDYSSAHGLKTWLTGVFKHFKPRFSPQEAH